MQSEIDTTLFKEQKRHFSENCEMQDQSYTVQYEETWSSTKW